MLPRYPNIKDNKMVAMVVLTSEKVTKPRDRLRAEYKSRPKSSMNLITPNDIVRLPVSMVIIVIVNGFWDQLNFFFGNLNDIS